MKSILALGLVVALAACGEEPPFDAADEQFVATMVELRRAAESAGADTARFEELRQSVLEERGVTPEELRAYVDAHAGNLDHMAIVWDSVSARLATPEIE